MKTICKQLPSVDDIFRSAAASQGLVFDEVRKIYCEPVVDEEAEENTFEYRSRGRVGAIYRGMLDAEIESDDE